MAKTPKYVTEEPGPSRPQLRAVRRAYNSKHDVPCGQNCLLYPKGKIDHTPGGFPGKVAKYLELDVKSRPARLETWLEKKGEKKKPGGRHRDCGRPNRFFPAIVAEGEGGENAAQGQGGQDVAQVDGGGDAVQVYGGQGRREGARERVPPAIEGEPTPADNVALAWRRLDDLQRARAVEARASEERQREAPREEASRPRRDWRRMLRRRERPAEGEDPFAGQRGRTGRVMPLANIGRTGGRAVPRNV